MEQKMLHIAPVGVLRKDENGVRVELEPAYTPGLLGLELYSHVHILWWFDRRDNPEDRSRLQVRPPHRGTPGPMGVFASRSPSRPNPIALSTGRILNVDRERGILTPGLERRGGRHPGAGHQALLLRSGPGDGDRRALLACRLAPHL